MCARWLGARLTDKLDEKSMELTFIFNTLALDKANSDRRRGYQSWISSRNLSNKARDEVVEALVESVTGSYGLVARHYQLKKSLLGFDELFDYDRYAPLNLKESDSFYAWEEARDIVLSAFEKFSPAMQTVASEFFDNDWIHAPVLPSKRGGAFAASTVPSANPFVFLNFLGATRDVTTLAHELGHGIHMALSGPGQGFVRALHAIDHRRNGIDLRRDAGFPGSDGGGKRPRSAAIHVGEQD